MEAGSIKTIRNDINRKNRLWLEVATLRKQLRLDGGWGESIIFTGLFRLFSSPDIATIVVCLPIPLAWVFIFYLYYFHIDFILPASITLINYNIYYYCCKFLFIILMCYKAKVSKLLLMSCRGIEPRSFQLWHRDADAELWRLCLGMTGQEILNTTG